MPNDRFIAYFTMEIALEPGMPTYSGGLGSRGKLCYGVPQNRLP